MCGATHSTEKANTGGTVATVHWSEKSLPELVQSLVDHQGGQQCARLFSEILLSSYVSYILQPNMVYKWFRVQRQDRMELKGDQWVKLRNKVLRQIAGDFLLKPLRVFVFSPHSGTFATDIYRTVMLLFRHCYDSHSWIRKVESWNSSTSEMHQSTGNQRAIHIYSLT